MSAPVPTELEEHRLLVAYLRVRRLRFTHVANETGGGRHGRMQAIRNMRNGVSPGFPDFLVIVGDQLIGIEMKRRKGGTVAESQKHWIEALNDVGVMTRVCKGFDEARKFIEEVQAMQKQRAA